MVQLRIEDLEEYASKNRIPIMQKDGINFLVDYIKNNNIKNILEIGTAIGYSAITMALVRDDIKVTTIERDKDRYDLAIKNIREFNLENRITVILEDALDVDITGVYDLVFIDAAKSQYIKFFEKFDKNLCKGGVVVSDNLSFHGMVEDDSKINNRNTRQLVQKIRKYIDYLKNNERYETIFYKLGDGVSVSIKK